MSMGMGMGMGMGMSMSMGMSMGMGMGMGMSMGMSMGKGERMGEGAGQSKDVAATAGRLPLARRTAQHQQHPHQSVRSSHKAIKAEWVFISQRDNSAKGKAIDFESQGRGFESRMGGSAGAGARSSVLGPRSSVLGPRSSVIWCSWGVAFSRCCRCF